MTRLSARVDDYLNDGIEWLEETTSMTKSDVVRAALRDYFTRLDGDVPEHVEKQATHEQALREHKPELRTMHFKQRSWEYVRDCLFNQQGDIKRYPPSPDKVRRHYQQMIQREVAEEHEEYREEFEDHIEQLMDWYGLMHPETDVGGPYEQAVELAAHYMRWGETDKAKRVAQKAENKSSHTQHEILDEARQRKARSTWKNQWDEAVRGDGLEG